MIKVNRAYPNYVHTAIESVDGEGNSIEGYKTIPAWVCKNLILYNTCFINNILYKKIGREILKEYDPKMTITPFENGMVLRHGN